MVVYSCVWFHSVCTLVFYLRIQLHLYSDIELETVLSVLMKQCCCLGIPFFWHGWTLWYWLAFQCNLFLPSRSSILLTCIMTTASIDLLCICALWLDGDFLYRSCTSFCRMLNNMTKLPRVSTRPTSQIFCNTSSLWSLIPHTLLVSKVYWWACKPLLNVNS